MELYELKEETERVILVGVATRENEDVQESLDELEELAETAGAQVVGRVVQSREGIHPGYYVGTGKLEEIQMAVRGLDATGIICDDELSPSQMNNLERELECKVMDRTVVILDIFAARAKTSEGKIQVELAQLRYRAARLTGLGTSLSRLGGGIGTRGPGEKKLEMDRRLIKTRISQLKRELEQVKRHRELLREGRKKDNLLTGAIVGYTNAGKSTLLNTLTHAGVLEEDKLFATLDPTTRVLELPGKQKIYLTDTVGFIRKLPHHLIEAFKSTLEEAKYADVIIHVVDASNPQRDQQMYVVYETLKELGVKDKKVVTLFNFPGFSGGLCPQDFRTDWPGTGRFQKSYGKDPYRKPDLSGKKLQLSGSRKDSADQKVRTASGGRIYPGRNLCKGQGSGKYLRTNRRRSKIIKKKKTMRGANLIVFSLSKLRLISGCF